jgi:hypothetical protein
MSVEWNEVFKVQSGFCNKLMDIPNCAANGFAGLKLGRESRIGRCIGELLKY